MEGSEVVVDDVGGRRENGSSGDGRPPVPNTSGVASSYGCLNSTGAPSSFTKTRVRHPSLVQANSPDITIERTLNGQGVGTVYMPLLRSGAWSDSGPRPNMEDVFVCADNMIRDYGQNDSSEKSTAFYGVFDGHEGKHAADFACYHLPRFIIEDGNFPQDIEQVITSAFLRTDTSFAEACSVDADLASGTTALAAIVIGSSLVVANAGDCRAVLCRRGRAIEMSRDHKPVCIQERIRIEASGGYVFGGYLNGQLTVTRALGDWHMEGLKGQDGGPLSAEPEFMSTVLTEDDEFLIIGCDGLWDVFMSQNAVDFARRRLQEHNDPLMCSKDLVYEALKRESGDNLAVIVVCFQQQPPPKFAIPHRQRVHRSVSAEGFEELQRSLDGLDI